MAQVCGQSNQELSHPVSIAGASGIVNKYQIFLPGPVSQPLDRDEGTPDQSQILLFSGCNVSHLSLRSHGVMQDIVRWSHFHLPPLQAFLRPYLHLIEQRSNCQLQIPNHPHTSLDWWMVLERLDMGISLDIPHRLILTTDVALDG